MTDPAWAGRDTDAVSARYGLNTQERVLYDRLRSSIARVAEGRQVSTEFRVPASALLTSTRMTGKELTGSRLHQSLTDQEEKQVSEAWDKRFDYDRSSVRSALWLDCPYELFWMDLYDKHVVELKPKMHSVYDKREKDWVFFLPEDACVTFRFPVLEEYQKGPYEVDPALTGPAVQARKNARDIVDKYEDCSDYIKLAGYVAEICKMARYDGNATNKVWQAANPQKQDQWKLISVLDGDDDTNAVCEGYSQAFQYLCQLSSFDENISCCLVTGHIGSREHSWNLVRMDDGKSYLVDVTWMDSNWDGMEGGLAGWISENQGRLFLCGGRGDSVRSGYSIYNREGKEEGFRSYRRDTLAAYPEDFLTLSDQPYMLTGFQKLPGGIWYFDEEGAFVRGKKTIDGKRCLFEKDGKLHQAHKWNKGKITKKPTKKSDGVRTYTCTVCGKTRTEAVSLKKDTDAKGKSKD